jgi:DNA-binding MarR family transcriptional regulator
MAGERTRVDEVTRRRVQELLLLGRRMTIVLDAPFQRAGLGELHGNRSVQLVMLLNHRGPIRPRDLQGPIGLTSGGLTKLVDRLVELGVIERYDRGGAGDGRAVLVRLTRKGHATVRHLHRVLADAHDDLRPVGKEILQLTEAIGGRRTTPTPPFTDLPTAMSRAGLVILSALGDADDRLDRDDFQMLLALCQIDLLGGCRPGTLIDALGLSSGGVSKLLDRLEAHGWITREYGTLGDDRRAVVLHTTESGEHRLREQVPRVMPHLDEFWNLGHLLADGFSQRR